MQDRIIWTFRAPRVVLAMVAGAGPSVAGTALQALVRNPLADSYILGVNQGASLGAVAVLVLGSSALGGVGLSTAAFVGAMVALALVFLLGQRGGRSNPHATDPGRRGHRSPSVCGDELRGDSRRHAGPGRRGVLASRQLRQRQSGATSRSPPRLC